MDPKTKNLITFLKIALSIFWTLTGIGIIYQIFTKKLSFKLVFPVFSWVMTGISFFGGGVYFKETYARECGCECNCEGQ